MCDFTTCSPWHGKFERPLIVKREDVGKVRTVEDGKAIMNMFGPVDEVCPKRKKNFSYPEINALIKGVKSRYSIIKGTHGLVGSADMKKRAWDEITEEVNLVSHVVRQVSEIRRKWVDLTCAAKRKNIQFQRYSNNEGKVKGKKPPPLGPVEKRVLALIENDGVTDSPENSKDDNLMQPPKVDEIPMDFVMASAVYDRSRSPSRSSTSTESDSMAANTSHLVVGQEALLKAICDIRKIEKRRLLVERQRLKLEKDFIDYFKIFLTSLKCTSANQ